MESDSQGSGPLPSDSRPLGARWCVYYGCRREAALITTVDTLWDGQRSCTDNPLCARHAEQAVACWVRELLAGGPTFHLSMVRAIPPATREAIAP